MGKQALTATVTQTTEVVLSPKLRQALQTKLTAYAKLAADKKGLKARMDALTVELDALRDEAEEMSVSLEGYGTVTLVAGEYSKFNPKLFVALGGELSVYKAAVELKPKKAFTKVTVAGVVEDGDDE
jgi:ABC-type phosphate transport system auxiliary subunit